MISSANNPNKVKVTILGQVYTIEGDASGDHIIKVADYVNQKMEDVANTISCKLFADCYSGSIEYC